jgi:hypothetical protein
MPCAEERERHPLCATNLPQSLFAVLPRLDNCLSPADTHEHSGAYPQLYKRLSPS